MKPSLKLVDGTKPEDSRLKNSGGFIHPLAKGDLTPSELIAYIQAENEARCERARVGLWTVGVIGLVWIGVMIAIVVGWL